MINKTKKRTFNAVRSLIAVLILSTAMVTYSQDNLDKGIAAVNVGDYVTALNLLKGVSKDKYEANLYYGIALFNTGSVSEAEKFIKAAIRGPRHIRF
jgi:hypothetical protein